MIDTDTDLSEVSESELEREFGDLNNLSESPGWHRFKSTMETEFQKIVNTVFDPDVGVVDVSTFFAREESIAQGKVLRRYMKLVDERRAELKDQLEQNRRAKTTETH